ncbi:MAG: ATP-binding cassette domain-containing protein, partial [Meiothermus sp.]|uniref:ATP-binding cassette domain-containing protein n=1 Tax=Meiothermus sp. TaxID=1955249 RepID=UPI00298F1707
VGQLVAAYGLVQNAVGALGALSGAVLALQEGSVASDRLMEVVELEPEPEGQAQTLPPLQNAVQIEDLSFAYLPERPLLKNLSLTLPKGSYTVLLGPNGAGKSTLAALLSRMLTPSGGCIRWDGHDLSELPPAAVRERVAYLRPEVPLFYATLRENLTLGRHLPDETLWQTLDAVGLRETARRLPEGLETTLGGDSLYRLSSGEKQMLGLARALLSGAELLILDEPTATLDPTKEAHIVELLARLKGPLTLLVITHRPALLKPADQVFYLEEGRLRPYSPEVPA